MMMKIIVVDPKSEILRELEATPLMRAGISGWEVEIAAGNRVWMTDQDGKWSADPDKKDLDPLFIQAIGESINPPLS